MKLGNTASVCEGRDGPRPSNEGTGRLKKVRVGWDGLRQHNEDVEGLKWVLATKQGY